MLRGLDISDMLIIDRLELAFQPGLNVLTGETGAGKVYLAGFSWALFWVGAVVRIWCVKGGHRAR